jgi:FkbM family methyltransferase
VVAVEASGHNSAIARLNAELNSAPQLEVIHAAAARRYGTLTVNRGLNARVDDGSGAWGRTEVAAASVDELAARYGAPDVLFVDVEGFEVEVLAGAVQTLGTFRPDVFVEVRQGSGLELFGGSAAKVLSFFPSSIYRLFLRDGEIARFALLKPGGEIPGGRFFLVSICAENRP